jgi:hypothetical protein
MLRVAVLAALGTALMVAAPASAGHHAVNLGATGRALVTIAQRRRRASADPVARRQHPVALEA